MAITVTPEVSGQVASSTFSYCYLYEPLRVLFSEDTIGAKKMYVDLVVLDYSNDTVVIDSLIKYVEFDIFQNQSISIDLMKIVRQYFDSNIYKIGHENDIIIGQSMSLVNFKFQFEFYSDITVTKNIVKKAVIIGGRNFYDFTINRSVTELSPITEFQKLGLSQRQYQGWNSITTILKAPTLSDIRPNPSLSIGIGDSLCGYMLYWKSRLGGWMNWGFNGVKENKSGSYSGKISVEEFESGGVNPYVEVNYSAVINNYTISLKSYGLNPIELEAVAEISASPTVYLMRDNIGGHLELMKVNSSSAPINNLTGGGDFSVVLQNISRTTSNVR